MASKQKIGEILALIKTIYPYFYKDNNIEELRILTKVWEMTFADYEDGELNNAAMLCIQNCKTPPTPADIIEQIEKLRPKRTNEELFAKMSEALQKCNDLQYYFDFTAKTKDGKTQGQEAREKAALLYSELPPSVRLYIGSYGEFLRMAREIDDDTLKYERARFMKAVTDIRQEVKTRQLASADRKKLNQ